MDQSALSSRAIIGEYYRRLEADPGASWIGGISNYFMSDQESETYKWLGMSPAMREWVGGRHAKGFKDNGITIANKHYEATVEFALRDLRRDKTGQIFARIGELAERTNSHWASALSTLILNGESTACYDGQFYFDTDHAEGKSGTQSNDISVDVSALPVAVAGSTTAPGVAEMQLTVLKAVQAIAGFKDDQGEPMNETATDFVVMVPSSLHFVAMSALSTMRESSMETSAFSGFNISAVANARLTWTDKLAVFRTDGSVKPLIRQEEQEVDLKVKGEGSEFEFDNAAHQYGVDTWRNVGYGYWQHACLATMT